MLVNGSQLSTSISALPILNLCRGSLGHAIELLFSLVGLRHVNAAPNEVCASTVTWSDRYVRFDGGSNIGIVGAVIFNGQGEPTSSFCRMAPSSTEVPLVDVSLTWSTPEPREDSGFCLGAMLSSVTGKYVESASQRNASRSAILLRELKHDLAKVVPCEPSGLPDELAITLRQAIGDRRMLLLAFDEYLSLHGEAEGIRLIRQALWCESHAVEER